MGQPRIWRRRRLARRCLLGRAGSRLGIVFGLLVLKAFLGPRFNLPGVRVGQRTMPAGIGVNLGAIRTDGAKARELVRAGDLERLNEPNGKITI